MKLLVSTACGLITIEGSCAPFSINTIEKTSYNACYWGITWNEKDVFAIKREFGETFFVHVFDRKLKETGKFEVPGVKDPHQIFWKDGKLYIANTGHNRITIWDGKDFGEFAWNKTGRDDNHINSIWADDEYFYFIENRGDPHLGGRSRIRAYLKRNMELTSNYQVGRDVHNVMFEKRNYYICSSADKSLLCYSWAKKEVTMEWRANLELNNPKVFTRGLAYDGECFYVGISESRTKQEKKDKVIKDGRIAVINNDFKTAGIIQLPKSDSVHDVRLMDKPDYAHNGVRF